MQRIGAVTMFKSRYLLDKYMKKYGVSKSDYKIRVSQSGDIDVFIRVQDFSKLESIVRGREYEKAEN